MKLTGRAPWAGLLAIAAAGCGGASMGSPSGGGGIGGAAGGGASGGGSGDVTYYKDVRPILEAHCTTCHNTDGIAPFPFTSYDGTKGYAAAITTATSTLEMPPWKPTAGCGDFRDVRRLSSDEIATFAAWSAAGAPAGNPADAPPTPDAGTGGSLGPPSALLDPGTDYQPNTALTDDYHCFLIDPGLSAAQDMIGFEVHPGTPTSVHHVLLFAVPAANVADAQAADAAEAGPGWTCFGGSGVNAAQTIGGWVPGSGASMFPPPTGIHLAAGTQIVMQIHYNLLTQAQFSDRTTAGLYYASAPVAKPAAISAVVNKTFDIPAGVASQTVTADLAINRSWALWGVVPHMHLHGKHISVAIHHADGSSTCAVDIPSWDFHWQQFYYYQQPVAVVAGDTIHLECTYDNSADDQPIINGVKQPPMDLTWGEKTTDEMCLNYLYFTLP
jgi:hypothetical protein